MKKFAGQFLFIFVVTVSLLEMTLQAYAYWGKTQNVTKINATDPEDKYWTVDPVSGWINSPNARGTYKGRYFSGEITIGPDGNRLNARESTFRKGYDNILFIGDSTTAGFEVNDSDTLPALLEQDLRGRGKRVNVINLGVRGYGTDQSVQRALPFIKTYQPKEIIYLFTGNDIADNHFIKNGYRKYSKGVFFAEDSKTFVPRNFPVKQLPISSVSFMFMDKQCRPHFFYSDKILPGGAPVKTLHLLKTAYLYLFGLPVSKPGQKRIIGQRRYDIVAAMRITTEQSKRWCPDYHRAYFSHQIGLLRRAAPKANIKIVLYPRGDALGKDLLEKLGRNEQTPVIDLADEIKKDGLNRNQLECVDDPHFCLQGNQWARKKLVALFEE